MGYAELRWQSRDDVEMFAEEWSPDGIARGVVCHMHGHGEHSGRHSRLAEVLVAEGFTFLALHTRGHGRSAGKRGHAPSYTAVMDDVQRLLEVAESRHTTEPRYLYGHSMGGNFALNYALLRRPDIAGVIATSPWLRLTKEPHFLLIALAHLMNVIMPSFSLSTRDNLEDLAHDSAIVDGYADDPLVHNRMSARLFVSMRRAGTWALRHAGDFPVPLLLMHGEADKITDPEGSKIFAGKVSEGCTLRLWPGLYHDLHAEPERDQVFGAMLEWLDRQNAKNRTSRQ